MSPLIVAPNWPGQFSLFWQIFKLAVRLRTCGASRNQAWWVLLSSFVRAFRYCWWIFWVIFRQIFLTNFLTNFFDKFIDIFLFLFLLGSSNSEVSSSWCVVIKWYNTFCKRVYIQLKYSLGDKRSFHHQHCAALTELYSKGIFFSHLPLIIMARVVYMISSKVIYMSKAI